MPQPFRRAFCNIIIFNYCRERERVRETETIRERTRPKPRHSIIRCLWRRFTKSVPFWITAASILEKKWLGRLEYYLPYDIVMCRQWVASYRAPIVKKVTSMDRKNVFYEINIYSISMLLAVFNISRIYQSCCSGPKYKIIISDWLHFIFRSKFVNHTIACCIGCPIK